MPARCCRWSSTVRPGCTCPGTWLRKRRARGTRRTGDRDVHGGRARVQLPLTGCAQSKGTLDGGTSAHRTGPGWWAGMGLGTWGHEHGHGPWTMDHGVGVERGVGALFVQGQRNRKRRENEHTTDPFATILCSTARQRPRPVDMI